ncbi:MAG: hypothetical protein B6V02_02290 [Thermoprotei archaeon ex4572_64]|nr:MAG: hypothetical protein B6V02_02290 [Thermoprotei archaeon ex4572_64]
MRLAAVLAIVFTILSVGVLIVHIATFNNFKFIINSPNPRLDILFLSLTIVCIVFAVLTLRFSREIERFERAPPYQYYYQYGGTSREYLSSEVERREEEYV